MGWPIRKNDTSGATLVFPIYDADGDLVSGATGLDSEISKDGASFGDVTAEATEINSSGIYSLALAQAEINADYIVVITKTTTTGAKTAVNVVYTSTRNIDDLAYPTVSGRSVDTLATGEVGIDLDNTQGTIAAAQLAADCITNAKIADDAIAAENLATGALTADAFAADAIVAATLATGALTADAFAADALVAATFATDAIAADALAADAIAEIADAVLDEDMTGHQTQGSLGQAIGDPAADTDTIFGMLTDFEDGTTVPDVNVKTVTADAITAAAIAAGAIDAATFAAGAINAAAIADAAIDAATFASGAINAAAIAADAITEAKIADDAIAAEHLATGAFTADAFAADAIVAATLATGALTADAFAADALVAATFATDAIAADALAADAVTEIATGVFQIDMDAVEAAAPVHSLASAVLKAVSKVEDDAGTLKTYRTNGTTVHMQQTVATDAGLDPIDSLTIGVAP